MDERKRELERNAAASGDPDAVAQLLQQRLRAGELTEERVQVAAWLGSEGAAQLAEPNAEVLDDPFLFLPVVEDQWRGSDNPLILVDGFARQRADALIAKLKGLPDNHFSEELTLELRVRCELLVIGILTRSMARPLQGKVREALWAAEAYWCEREELQRNRFLSRLAAIDPEQNGPREVGDTTCVPDCCWGDQTATVVCCLVLARTMGLMGDLTSGFRSVWKLAFWLKREPDVAAALGRELIPWALGDEDPLNLRVERRTKE